MGIFIFYIFVGLFSALIKSEDFKSHNFDFNEQDTRHLDASYLSSYSSGNLVENLPRSLDPESFFGFFDSLLSKYDLNQHEDLDEEESLTHTGGKFSGNAGDKVARAMVEYLGSSARGSCGTLSENFCSYVRDTSSLTDGMSVVKDACSEKEKICQKVLKYLKKVCEEIKEEQQKLLESDGGLNEKCKEQLEKCDDLKENCDNILDETCKQIREKCKTPGPTPPSPTIGPGGKEITLTHTVITTYTAMETVVVSAEDVYTETLIKTKWCCQCKPTGPEFGKPRPKPEPEPEPEPEEPERPGEPEKPGEPDEPSEPGKPEEPEEPEEPEGPEGPEEPKPKPEEPQPEPQPEPEPEPGPEPEPEPDEPATTDGECSITVTVTSTPQNAGNEAECKDDGFRLKGLHAAGLIYVVIGIMIGIWIIV